MTKKARKAWWGVGAVGTFLLAAGSFQLAIELEERTEVPLWALVILLALVLSAASLRLIWEWLAEVLDES